MPEQWTADIVAQMHLHKIKAVELAKALDWHPKYLSAVLNGHRTPNGAETAVSTALRSIVESKA